MSPEFGGELACLAAATMWAVAVAIFRRPIRRFGAPVVNLLKSIVASGLLGLTVLATGQWEEILRADGRSLWVVALSGWIGLTLGDTALFAAVGRIGPYRTLLLQTLAPVFTTLFAVAWLGTIPTPGHLVGIAIILGGVLLVVFPDRSRIRPPKVRGARAWVGYLAGVVAALGQGVGIVLAKDGMQDLPFVPATFFRLAAASCGLVLLTGLTGWAQGVGRATREAKAVRRIVGASFLGTYLAMLCMMAGVRLAPPAVAATLLSTTPVFSMFIEARITGEKITPRRLFGTFFAILGVAVLVR